MDEAEMYTRVEMAIKSFLERDCQLLYLGANERSVSHKIAEHLQRQFPEYHIDCEYNRHGELPKTIIVNYEPKETPVEDLEAKTVFPDIIIHERGHDENNLMVIEIKKNNSTQDAENDFMKLRAFTSQEYRYTTGLFLRFDVDNGKISEVHCFQKGTEHSDSIWQRLVDVRRDE